MNTPRHAEEPAVAQPAGEDTGVAGQDPAVPAPPVSGAAQDGPVPGGPTPGGPGSDGPDSGGPDSDGPAPDNPDGAFVGDVLTSGDLLTDTLTLAETRLADLQRERAEFVNFRRRTERDIAAARSSGVAGIVEALLPVLDDISLARTHGDLDGTPFAAIAEKLDATLARFGVEVFGQVGDAFDPAVHEALLHEALPAEHAGSEVAVTTRVLQPGYRLGERVLRPARVAVADPG